MDGAHFAGPVAVQEKLQARVDVARVHISKDAMTASQDRSDPNQRR